MVHLDKIDSMSLCLSFFLSWWCDIVSLQLSHTDSLVRVFFNMKHDVYKVHVYLHFWPFVCMRRVGSERVGQSPGSHCFRRFAEMFMGHSFSLKTSSALYACKLKKKHSTLQKKSLISEKETINQLMLSVYSDVTKCQHEHYICGKKRFTAQWFLTLTKTNKARKPFLPRQHFWMNRCGGLDVGRTPSIRPELITSCSSSVVITSALCF